MTLEGYRNRVSEQDGTIVRTWNARATPLGAERYRLYFADTLLPQLRQLSGFAGGYLLSRQFDEPNETVELFIHTFLAVIGGDTFVRRRRHHRVDRGTRSPDVPA